MPQCLETFPFPEDWEENQTLETIGQTYYDYRAKLMVDNDEGLTKTYNRFHDPEESSPEIHKLRELHAEMDRAVLDAYGWTDIPTACEFIPDYYEEDKDGNEVPKSIRYRWPDEVRDEVLARLLALNAERYQQEVNTGLHAKKSAKKKTTRKRPAKKAAKKTSQPPAETPTDLPGIDAWEQRINALAPAIPPDMRFPLGGAVRYYQFLVRGLVQEAGGRLSYALFHTAIKQLQTGTVGNHWKTTDANLFQQWESSFKEDIDPAGFVVAEEQFFTARNHQGTLVGTAPNFEIRLNPDTPEVTDPWFLLDAHLLLKSALAAQRNGETEAPSGETLSRITQFIA